MLYILGRDRFDPFERKAVARQLVIGYRAAEHDFSQRIEPGDVRRRVGLGIAEILGLPERLGIVHTAALHRVEHEVGRAVEDAADGEDPVALGGKGKIVQEGHRAAAGRAEEKAHALFRRERSQLRPVRGNERLV